MGITVKSQFRFDAGKVLNDIRPKAFDRVLANAQETVKFMRCPEHGDSSTLTMDGRDQETATLNISACCDAFRKSVRDAIRQKP